jgi:hypothetical protein
MRNDSGIQVLCAEFQTLLAESQVALTDWNQGRAKIHKSRRRGPDADSELRILQGNFAKAWALLQFHEHDCEICQLISSIHGDHSRTDARLHQSYN